MNTVRVSGTAEIRIDFEQMAIDEIALILGDEGMKNIEVNVVRVKEPDDLPDDWFDDLDYTLSFSGEIDEDLVECLRNVSEIIDVKVI